MVLIVLHVISFPSYSRSVFKRAPFAGQESGAEGLGVSLMLCLPVSLLKRKGTEVPCDPCSKAIPKMCSLYTSHIS